MIKFVNFLYDSMSSPNICWLENRKTCKYWRRGNHVQHFNYREEVIISGAVPCLLCHSAWLRWPLKFIKGTTYNANSGMALCNWGLNAVLSWNCLLLNTTVERPASTNFYTNDSFHDSSLVLLQGKNFTKILTCFF